MKFLLWFGMSQTGKSSAIKLLTGDQTIKCGQYGVGASTTSEVRVYKDIKPKLSQKYYYVDTIGLGDNRLQYNDAEIRNHIEKEIIRVAQQHNVTAIDAILVTQSFSNQVLSLPIIFQQIKNILGHFPATSIVVLGTKKNDCKRKFLENRTAQIHKALAKFGVPANKFLEFSTPCPDADFQQNQIDNSQYGALYKLLASCKSVQLQSIAQKQKQISNRAAQIQKEKTTIKVQHSTREQVKYKKEKKISTVKVEYKQRAGGLKGLLGKTSTRFKDQQVQTEVDVPYKVQVPVQINVPVVPAYDYCYHLALAEFEKQFIGPLAKQK